MDILKTNIRMHLFTMISRVLALCRHWRQRVQERAELCRLDDRALRDLGITRVDAMKEADKPFWCP